jgi:gamma-glutamyltranspeptidase / glutathione hydrolase
MLPGPDTFAATSWRPVRQSPIGRGGIVGAKTPQAAEAGIEMLRRGGNAIDAAIATAFAVSVCEPWMNGIGGGGFLVAWLAKEQRSVVISYPMISAAGATEDMFPLAGSGTNDSFLFGWPATVDNANVLGHRSVAVPGTVAGLALALQRYGTMTLADVLQPAIDLAETGFPVSWHATLTISKDLANIHKFPEAARIFLTPAGHPPVTTEQHSPAIIRQPDLAATLRSIANDGPRAFYEGDIAREISSHLAEHGSPITYEDFSSYEAMEEPAISVTYHGTQVYTVGGGTGGTSLAQSLVMLDHLRLPAPDKRSAMDWHRIIQVFRQAFADRFSWLADPNHVEIPQDALLDPAYARECLASFPDDQAIVPKPGDRSRLGITHGMPGSVPEYFRDGSTTHLGVIDGEGNTVSLTQTLLAAFGSRVIAPGTGVLLNNGMMWFDPEPGRPNSVRGRKTPLSNMAPAVVTRDGQAFASVGSSGGRRIQNANAQIIVNLVDGGVTAQEAVDAPRIDTSTPGLALSARIDEGIRDALGSMGHPVSVRHEHLMTADFASPVVLRRAGDGTLDGGADPYYFPATVIAMDAE